MASLHMYFAQIIEGESQSFPETKQKTIWEPLTQLVNIRTLGYSKDPLTVSDF